MNIQDRVLNFQEAQPASPDANRMSPIKLTVTKYYHHKALPPVLTFYMNKQWLLETFGITDESINVSFRYDDKCDPPAGIIAIRDGAAKLKNAGPYTLKANFYGWPALDGDSYDKRCECPIIMVGPDSVSFHMPGKQTHFNPNTNKWERRGRVISPAKEQGGEQ